MKKNKQANNVILFPGVNKPSTIPINIPAVEINIEETKEDINEKLEEVRTYHIQETINILIPQIFSQLHMAGFTPKSEEDEFCIKEGAFIVEALRSHMYSYYGMKHPFQRIVEKVFIEDKEDKNSLVVAKSLKVILKD